MSSLATVADVLNVIYDEMGQPAHCRRIKPMLRFWNGRRKALDLSNEGASLGEAGIKQGCVVFVSSQIPHIPTTWSGAWEDEVSRL